MGINNYQAQKELTFTLCKERRQYGELVRPEPSWLLELASGRSYLGAGATVITAEERMHKGQANVANICAMLAKPKRSDNYLQAGKAKPPPGTLQRVTTSSAQCT